MISILLPTYNRPEYLQQSIESILSQDYTDYEILLLDNGSDKATQDYISQITDSRIKKHRQYKNNDQNPWLYLSNFASGEYIIFWTDDDIMLPGNLSSKIQVIISTGMPAVCSAAAGIDKDGQEIAKIFGKNRHNYIFLADLLPSCQVVMPSVLFSAKYLAQLREAVLYGPFMDWYMWLSMCFYGNIAYIDKPLMQLRIHANSDTTKCKQDGSLLASYQQIWQEWIEKARDKRGVYLNNTQKDAMLLIYCHLSSLSGISLEQAIISFYQLMHNIRQ